MTTVQPSAGTAARVLLLLGLLALLAFWGHWRGEFVHDDVHQIRGNGLLRSWPGTLEAMGKDVWAFKGERQQAWSNYWRPGFVSWLALNYRVFGVDSATGWHWTSFALHWLACWLGYRLLRRAGFGPGLALAVAAVFAVHPAHVESVGWISGSPDPLVSCLLIGSLLTLPATGRPRLSGRWFASLLLYTLALLTKEISILAPFVVVALDSSSERTFHPLLPKLVRAAPFAALAGLFVVSRAAVLGQQQIAMPWQLSLGDVVLTVPRLVLFYAGQALLPLRLSPGYPVRTAYMSQASPWDWLLLVAVAAIVGLCVYLGRRDTRLALAFALFALPLLPAMNVGAFLPEHLVHDRYLYLPLLGAWAAIVILAGRSFAGLRPSVRTGLSIAGISVVVALLALQTHRYLPVWQSETAIWQRNVEIDPDSAFGWAQYGTALLAAGEEGEARRALDRSLALFPNPIALLTRADLLRDSGDLSAARRDLESVLAAQPLNTRAVERLAVVLERQGSLDEAAELLLGARERIPHHRCVLTVDLAVVLYVRGERARALGELESVRSLVTPASQPVCQLALFHLGNLYSELGGHTDGQAALRGFLEVTVSSSDPMIRQRREQARQAIVAAAR